MVNNNWHPKKPPDKSKNQSTEAGLRSETLTTAYEDLEVQIAKTLASFEELTAQLST